MKYPKLGRYRSTVTEIRKEYKVTPLDFDIVLYTSEQDYVTKTMLYKNVSLSKGSIVNSINYLKNKGFLKVFREGRSGVRGFPEQLVVSRRGRSMVMDFYMKMFPEYTNF